MFICNHRTPTDRVRRMARRRPKAAHTELIHVRDAVFHAPMFALNAEATQNACTHTEQHAVHAGRSARTNRHIYITRTHTHTHTHTYVYISIYIYIDIYKYIYINI